MEQKVSSYKDSLVYYNSPMLLKTHARCERTVLSCFRSGCTALNLSFPQCLPGRHFFINRVERTFHAEDCDLVSQKME